MLYSEVTPQLVCVSSSLLKSPSQRGADYDSLLFGSTEG